MTIDYTFKIINLHVIPNFNGNANIIKQVSWAIIGTYTDAEGKVYTYQHDQATTFKLNEEQTFIPSDQLDAATVQGWVEAIENTKFRNIQWLKDNIVQVRINDMVSLSTPKIVKPFWEQN